jgi:hypothetical protein
VVDPGPPFTLVAGALDHGPPTLGWRLEEPERRRMLPDRLAALGVTGEAVGRLQREGSIEAGGRRVTRRLPCARVQSAVLVPLAEIISPPRAHSGFPR